MRRPERGRLAAATIVSFAALSGCTGDRATNPVSAPPSLVPASLAFDGGGQVVIAAQLFSSPVASVRDSAGRAVPGIPVTFTAAGSGSVQPAVMMTDASGRASPDWFSGSGENDLTASAPRLKNVTITSHGLDSSNAAFYELVDVEPAFGVKLAGTIILGNGWFLTKVGCQAPATCVDSGWGRYGISGSSLSLEYQNQFLQYWNEYSENWEFGIIRGDTLEVNQTDSMWPPYSFRLSFVFRGGARP